MHDRKLSLVPNGWNAASEGCSPKNPSRSNTWFRGMLMLGRMA